LCSAAARSFCVDREIPFTILAFFPEYRMKDYRSPMLEEVVEAFQAVKAAGLKNVRLGNTGIFAHTEDQIQTLRQKVGMGHF
jgi:pyruvate-formate lyase-activating enzyme